MKIALAQTKAVKGDVAANIDNHLQMIETALAQGAAAVFFPELSLTGYEPELADALATTADDTRLEVFQQMSDKQSITIGVGMPLRTDKGITISMLIFQPNRPVQTYAKQRLHADEKPYFVEGDKQLILHLGQLAIAPAICYESLQAHHTTNAHQLGAKLYLASVAKSHKGINKAMLHYPAIARQHKIPVLMVNCVGYCDNFESTGASRYWNAEGELVIQMGGEEGVLVVEAGGEKLPNLVEP